MDVVYTSKNTCSILVSTRAQETPDFPRAARSRHTQVSGTSLVVKTVY